MIATTEGTSLELLRRWCFSWEPKKEFGKTMLPTEGPPHRLDCGEQEEKEMYKRKEAGEGDREQVR